MDFTKKFPQTLSDEIPEKDGPGKTEGKTEQKIIDTEQVQLLETKEATMPDKSIESSIPPVQAINETTDDGKTTEPEVKPSKITELPPTGPRKESRSPTKEKPDKKIKDKKKHSKSPRVGPSNTDSTQTEISLGTREISTSPKKVDKEKPPSSIPCEVLEKVENIPKEIPEANEPHPHEEIKTDSVVAEILNLHVSTIEETKTSEDVTEKEKKANVNEEVPVEKIETDENIPGIQEGQEHEEKYYERAQQTSRPISAFGINRSAQVSRMGGTFLRILIEKKLLVKIIINSDIMENFYERVRYQFWSEQ